MYMLILLGFIKRVNYVYADSTGFWILVSYALILLGFWMLANYVFILLGFWLLLNYAYVDSNRFFLILANYVSVDSNESYNTCKLCIC